jgi:biopolymer transport protein ExbB/TolQ
VLNSLDFFYLGILISLLIVTWGLVFIYVVQWFIKTLVLNSFKSIVTPSGETSNIADEIRNIVKGLEMRTAKTVKKAKKAQPQQPEGLSLEGLLQNPLVQQGIQKFFANQPPPPKK